MSALRLFSSLRLRNRSICGRRSALPTQSGEWVSKGTPSPMPSLGRDVTVLKAKRPESPPLGRRSDFVKGPLKIEIAVEIRHSFLPVFLNGMKSVPIAPRLRQVVEVVTLIAPVSHNPATFLSLVSTFRP